MGDLQPTRGEGSVRFGPANSVSSYLRQTVGSY